ncbi:hypothetical protein A2995_01505 [Candidatus Nomurabacteria bacterium RIFCSPLOWO2_01_FULL_33_24]|uniref:SHSP domain-containing protein n=1 Tax=Candidatus Nomurabacteria bacterium RIFCSPLOWO2_01_FULL_33_24 TaxID=1801765 RepID=A0A1F6X305_9BACT|nr:MAG: hypothetical protein A2995_01505 [Candidatus Nomurabacteria bacterium RIFCSPLOWO2_01_FULL_33_24]
MMKNKKRSFFERLTGGIKLEEHENTETEEAKPRNISELNNKSNKDKGEDGWSPEESEEAELAIDIHQTPTEIIVQTMIAGVRPEDIQINITRDTITIKGKREENKTIDEENYFARELYWGAFSRTIILPEEVEPDRAHATEKHGLLIIKIPKIDKGKQNNLKVKSI